MLSLQNNLKELPQADVILPSLELDSATSVRGDIFIMDEEIWKDIVGLENQYQISTYGRLRSVDRISINIKGYKKRYKGKLRAYSVNKNRYVVTSIIGKTYFIHVEVAKAFIHNPLNKKEVNHLDGDKSNCHVSNLEWATRLENIEHAFRNKLITTSLGEGQGNSVLTDELVRYIIKSDKGARELARELKLKHHTIISSVRLGKTWNHITGLPRNKKMPKRKFNI